MATDYDLAGASSVGGGTRLSSKGVVSASDVGGEHAGLLEALRESEARLRAVIEEAPLAMVFIGASGEILFRNPRFDQLWGRPAHVTTARTYSEVYEGYHLDGRRVASEEWPGARAVLKGEVIENEVYDIVQASGRRITCWFGAAPIRNASGEILGGVVVFRDVTEQRRTEAAMRGSEERQGFLLKLADALRPLADPSEIQAAAARILGEHLGVQQAHYGETVGEEVVIHQGYGNGRPPMVGRFRHRHFGQRLVQTYRSGRTATSNDVETDPTISHAERAVLAAAVIRAYVVVPLVKSGEWVAIFAVHSTEPRAWTGDEVALVEETAERTWATVERARAEAALHASEARFRALAETSPVGVGVSSAEGKIIYMNRAYEATLGYGRGELLGQPSVGVYRDPADRQAWLAAMKEKGNLSDHEVRLRRKDGSPVWVSINVAPIEFGGKQAIIGVTQDVTQRKLAEAVLARDKAELERLVAERTAKLQELVGELEHFSYTITHDLKAPLRAMKGFAELAGRMCGDGVQNEAKEALSKISVSAERMEGLITDALNYSRAMRQELPLTDVDTGALLRGMLETYPELQPSRAHIRVEGELPVVLGNEAGLTQCFSNLLANAVKFVRPGEKPEIRVWAEGQDGWTRIWVDDKGIGISREMLPRVFHMFSRGSKDYEGTGIGLALVRKVTQRMGGRVGVESEEGRGSRFWIELKLGQVRVKPGTVEFAREDPWGGTVLYVEDEESDAMFMRMAFARKGMESALRVVRDGRAAIEYLSGAGKYADRKEYPLPSAVLLDLNLPQVPGFEVLKWMRNHPEFAQTPAVVFSSSTREDDRVKTLELGANEFLVKPSSGLKFGEVMEGLQRRWLGKT